MTTAITHDWFTDLQAEKAWRPADYPPLAISISSVSDGEATRATGSVATVQRQSAIGPGQTTQAPPSEEAIGDDSFMQALREDSNREMDWLWLATQVSSALQRRYSLERALQINPRSAVAKRGLRQVRRHPDRPLHLI